MEFKLNPQRREKIVADHCHLVICQNALGYRRYKEGHKAFCSLRCLEVWREMKRSIKDGQ